MAMAQDFEEGSVALVLPAAGALDLPAALADSVLRVAEVEALQAVLAEVEALQVVLADSVLQVAEVVALLGRTRHHLSWMF
jgi:hypothetical protein